MQNGLGFASKFIGYAASEMSNKQPRSGNIGGGGRGELRYLPGAEVFTDSLWYRPKL